MTCHPRRDLALRYASSRRYPAQPGESNTRDELRTG